MATSRILDIMTESFLDGITGAALFGKLRRPGAPTVLVGRCSPEEPLPEFDAQFIAILTGGFPLRAADVELETAFEKAQSRADAKAKREAKVADGQTASFSRSKP